MSELPLLVDRFGRVHTDLRVSVTDRCNIRCQYCILRTATRFRPRTEILTFEELERVVRIVCRLGITKVRITGGEPLVRRGICDLVARFARIDRINDLAMTTNAVLLGRYAQPLREAGLQRVNISLDTLRADHFREITGRDLLEQVLEGIDAARAAGFWPIKLNALAIRDQTEREIPELARFARDRDIELRFIEFMPFDAKGAWSPDRVLTGEEIRALVSERVAPLESSPEPPTDAPALVYRYRDGRGRLGIISTVSHPFCDRCSRVRLTADGRILNCLFCREPVDIKKLLRSGADDTEVAQVIRDAIWAKKRQHGNDDGALERGGRAMNDIGG